MSPSTTFQKQNLTHLDPSSEQLGHSSLNFLVSGLVGGKDRGGTTKDAAKREQKLCRGAAYSFSPESGARSTKIKNL